MCVSALGHEDQHHSLSNKSKKRHGHGKHRHHKKEDVDDETEDFDADALIEVDGPHTVNEKQTHAHSTVKHTYFSSYLVTH